MHLHPEKLKQSIFLFALFALGAFLFWLLSGFLSAFLGAVVVYILLRPWHFYLTEKRKRKWSKTGSAILLMLFSFLVTVLPVFLLSLMLSSKVSYLIEHYADFLQIAKEYTQQASNYLGVDLLSQDTITKLTSAATEILPGIITSTANAVADVAVLYFVLFFMLINAREMETQVRAMLPFKDENDKLLLDELKNMTISNAVGVPLLAVMQAFCAWLGYLIFGVDQAFFWAVITGLFSVVPVVGTAIVWIPLAIFQYFSGAHWQGVAVAIYGAAIITNIDNVFRFMVQKRIGDTHPLITFFGVVIGLPLFGFVGIVFGPLLISYFLLLLKIYRNEYLSGESL